MFKDIDTFLAFITSKKTSMKSHPDDFKRLINDLGNPQWQLKCLHVAGTNGKGSVTNYLRSILQQAGYRVGTFTSPHLIVHNDRIRINDVYISDEELLSIANEHDQFWKDYDLSMFEIDMVISILYFLRQRVDYVVYEVGMGGRLDPTNIIHALASVIVNIGFDHMEYLGDTLDKIAYEKAGIIKENGLVFTAEDKPVCLQVFQETALAKHARLMAIEPITSWHLDDKIHFSYRDYPDIVLNTRALYQIKNAALALEVSDYLRKKDIIRLTRKDIIDGLASAFWKGRFEVVAQHPLVVIDGAHNEHGIKALLPSLESLPRPLGIVFSALKDKQYHAMIEDLKTCGDEIIITQFDNQRSTTARVLAEGLNVTVIDVYQEAISYALKKYAGGSVLITGSLYFISLVRELFKGVE
ncbi:MAG: folylpolyglutamate synthase/dihydrofolate synthase family protein [Erysipelotrichaceae bacterium]|nr:folylpolyglutamate synthase/dihydrofolate synthase family protein [Erysipelotrichaceae bacterium]